MIAMNRTMTPEESGAGAVTGGPLLVSQQQACQILGIGATTLYHLRRTGAVRSVLVTGGGDRRKAVSGSGPGRRLYVMASLREYVAGLEESQAQSQVPQPTA